MTWFNAIVFAAVIDVLGMSICMAMRGEGFDVLAVSISVFLLLSLPVALKFAGRKPTPTPKRRR